MQLPSEWKELIGLLCSHRVRFLVVGAHALAANGRPRATGDLDFWVEPTRANAKRLGRAIREFGFEGLAAEAAEFAHPDRMATLGVPPLRIDVMTSITGVAFKRAWPNRITAKFGRHEIGFLGREDLLENKRASGRPKDLADVALLLEGGPVGENVPQRRRRKKP
jgi:hypothetical protein